MPTSDPILAEQARTLARELLDWRETKPFRLHLKAASTIALLERLAIALDPFKVGDRVRIARKTLTRDAGGSVLWGSYMDHTIGQTGTIDRIDAGDLHVSLDVDPGGWCYPADALDLLPAEDAQ